MRLIAAMHNEVEREFSFVGWLSQMFLAYVGPSAALVAAATVAEVRSSNAWPWLVLYYAAVAALASLAARGLSALFPSSPIEGRWVWVVPLALEMCGLLYTLWTRPAEAPLFFYVPASMDGEAGLVLAMVTVPTWGCCWYSAVMWRRDRRRRAGNGTA